LLKAAAERRAKKAADAVEFTGAIDEADENGNDELKMEEEGEEVEMKEVLGRSLLAICKNSSYCVDCCWSFWLNREAAQGMGELC
jgi:hypothetical protein